MRIKKHRLVRIKLHSGITSCLVILVWLGCIFIPALSYNLAAAEPTTKVIENVDVKLLEGSWIRPDGGYILELKNIADDGTLTASYYNPQPINVFQAFWAMDEGRLAVFVELRDVNYPGSKYSLRYDPATDRLQGIYFQAIAQQTFTVEFVRQR